MLALVCTVVLTAAPSAQASPAAERELIRLVNVARAKQGLAPVRAALPLTRAARAHSRDMGRHGYFAHSTRSTGASFMQRILRQPQTASFRRFGETIGWGAGASARPAAVLRSWMASPPHRATLLSRRFATIGVGIWHGSFAGHAGAAVYTADFAG